MNIFLVLSKYAFQVLNLTKEAILYSTQFTGIIICFLLNILLNMSVTKFLKKYRNALFFLFGTFSIIILSKKE